MGIPEAEVVPDLAQQTHGSLLDTLNTPSPSPTSPSPSITSAGAVRLVLFYLSFTLSSHSCCTLFPPASRLHILPLISPLCRAFRALTQSLRPLLPVLLSSSTSSSFHLSITAIHSKRFGRCQRDGGPRRADRFIHPLLLSGRKKSSIVTSKDPPPFLFTPTAKCAQHAHNWHKNIQGAGSRTDRPPSSLSGFFLQLKIFHPAWDQTAQLRSITSKYKIEFWWGDGLEEGGVGWGWGWRDSGRHRAGGGGVRWGGKMVKLVILSMLARRE